MADVLAVGQYLAETLGAEHSAQGGLRQQARRLLGVVDVHHRRDGVEHAVVHHRVHVHRHRVFRQDLIRVNANSRIQTRRLATANGSRVGVRGPNVGGPKNLGDDGASVPLNPIVTRGVATGGISVYIYTTKISLP